MTAAATPGRELLACPFCGYAAMTHGDPTDKHEPGINISCSACSVEGGWFYGADCVDRATKHWNTRLAAKPADEGVREAGAGLPTSKFAKYKTGAELDSENAAGQRANIKRQIDDATYIVLHKGNYGLKHYLSDEEKRILSAALSTTGEPKR